LSIAFLKSVRGVPVGKELLDELGLIATGAKCGGEADA
jgi:hypothetical protein